MSLKSLMAAKKAQSRLSHPYAKYSPSNALSCSLCGPSTNGLKEVQWSSHLVSKGHRQNVRAAEAAAEKEKAGKRGREEEEESGEGEGGGGKRAREDALPADFFADPSMAPVRAASEEEEEEVVVAEVEAVGQAEPDDEWAAFEAELAHGPVAPPTVSGVASAGATIFSAPVIYEFGAPRVAEEGEEEAEEEQDESGETEDEKRERLEREEREEIMERIDEEEREQLEADEKVNVLKKRLDKLREARKKKQA